MFGKFGLADPSRSDKEEAADRAIWGTQSDTVTTDGLGNLIYSLVLTNDMGLEVISQVDELRLLFFLELANWNIGFLLDDGLDFLLSDEGNIFFIETGLLHFLILGNLIAVVGCFFIVFITGGLGLAVFSIYQSLIKLFGIDEIEG